MAPISRRRRKWRAQIRRGAHAISKTFAPRTDAEKWGHECERSVDMDLDPTARRFTAKDKFGALASERTSPTCSLAANGGVVPRMRCSGVFKPNPAPSRSARSPANALPEMGCSGQRLVQDSQPWR